MAGMGSNSLLVNTPCRQLWCTLRGYSSLTDFFYLWTNEGWNKIRKAYLRMQYLDFEKPKDWNRSIVQGWLWMFISIGSYFHWVAATSGVALAGIIKHSYRSLHLHFHLGFHDAGVLPTKTEILPHCDGTFSFHCYILDQPQHRWTWPKAAVVQP